MLWQDYVLTAGSIVFSVALIPAIKAKGKPPLSTSVPTFFFLYLFSFVYATLSLWISTTTTAITGTMWLILAGQKYMQMRRLKNLSMPQRDDKARHIERIKVLVQERGLITNDDVQREFGISDSTAERYLNELENTGFLRQNGQRGRGVTYRSS